MKIAGPRSLLALAAIGFFCSFARAITFSDGTFNDVDWTGTKIVDTTAGAVATFPASQSATGGNPGSFRATQLNLPAAGQITVAHAKVGALVTPSLDGAVQSVTCNYEFFANPATEFNFAPLIVQGGSYYQGTYVSVGLPTSGWLTFHGAPQHAVDFVLLSGPGPVTPNFSSGGTTIQLGYLTLFASGTAPTSRTTNLDNWSVVVAVPEPCTALAMAIMILAAPRRKSGRAGNCIHRARG